MLLTQNMESRQSSHHKIHGLSKSELRARKIAFIDDVISFSGDECVFWPFCKKRYPAALSVDGKTELVARIVCKRAHGNPPNEKAHAAHRCGNGHRSCVNPRHLRWATPKENAEDMIGHGTIMRGKRNPMTRLKENSVVKIKRMISDGISDAVIAKKFKRHEATIKSIRDGRSWSWLEA